MSKSQQVLVNLLPAINELYDLNLTPADITCLQESLNDFTAKTYNAFNINNLVFVLRKGNLVFTVSTHFSSDIYVNLEKYKSEEEVILNSYLSDGEKFYVYGSSSSPSFSNSAEEVLLLDNLKSAEADDLNNLYYLCHSLASVGRAIIFSTPQKAKNISELKKQLRQNFETNWRYISFHTDIDHSEITLERLISIFKSATPNHQKIKLTQTVQDKINKTLQGHSDMGVITDVYEDNNFRLFRTIFRSGYYRSIELKGLIRLFPFYHQHFNYVDVGRYYLNESASGHAFNPTSNKAKTLGGIIFSDLNAVFPTKEVLEESFKKINSDGDTAQLVSNADLDILARKWSQNKAFQADQKTQEDLLRKKLEVKIKSLKLDNASFKLNDTEFFSDYIKYHNQIIQFNKTDWISNALLQTLRGRDFDRITFDTLFESFLADIKQANYDGPLVGKIGELDITYKQEIKTNKIGVSSIKQSVNSVRINADEIIECLRRALCYTKSSDYKKFLQTISKCSLYYHHYLANGIILTVHDNFLGESYKLKLHLTRSKNLNFLKFNNKKFRISDSRALINLSNERSLLVVIGKLLSGRVVIDFGADDVKTLIKEGKKSYEQSELLRKKLTEDTEKLFKISKSQDIEFNNGLNVKEGYIIQGHIRKYALSTSEPYEVFSYPDGKYICMVDKTNSAKGEDKVINRIFALHNDKYIAPQISSLQLETQNQN